MNFSKTMKVNSEPITNNIIWFVADIMISLIQYVGFLYFANRGVQYIVHTMLNDDPKLSLIVIIIATVIVYVSCVFNVFRFHTVMNNIKKVD